MPSVSCNALKFRSFYHCLFFNWCVFHQLVLKKMFYNPEKIVYQFCFQKQFFSCFVKDNCRPKTLFYFDVRFYLLFLRCRDLYAKMFEVWAYNIYILYIYTWYMRYICIYMRYIYIYMIQIYICNIYIYQCLYFGWCFTFCQYLTFCFLFALMVYFYYLCFRP